MLTLAERLRDAAEKNEHKHAVWEGDSTITFAELFARAQQVADSLRTIGAERRNVLVAIPRSTDAVVGIVGTLLAGAAYVPIDLSQPRERNELIIRSCRAVAAVAATDQAEHTLIADRPIVTVTTDQCELRRPSAPTIVPPDATALIVFTSGSTGRPKGICLSHRAILSRCAHGYPYRHGDIQKAPLTAVAHVSDVLLPLLSGGPVIVASSEEVQSVVALGALAKKHGTTRLVFVPSQLAAVLEHPHCAASLSGITTLIVSGERLSVQTLEKCSMVLPSVTVYNGYGATEVGGLASLGAVTSGEPIHVGAAVGGVELLVVGDNDVPVREGSVGEIVIRGAQVASGYVDAPALSAERFGDPAECLYRTRDLGRFDASGRLIVVGRCDRELKISGLRVCPEEVESVLEAHDSVGRAVVVGIERNDRCELMAWVVAAQHYEVDAMELSAWLACRLPPHMLPKAISPIDQLPLLPGGKVDVTALVHSVRTLPSQQTAMCSDAERLATVWSRLLGVPIDIDDDVFACGADSIDAIRFCAEACKSGLVINHGDLRAATTPSAQASLIHTGVLESDPGEAIAR